jgi:hypothetical protein
MGSLIDDEVLDTCAVVAPVDEFGGQASERCDGVVDRVLSGFRSSFAEDELASMLQDLRQGRR